MLKNAAKTGVEVASDVIDGRSFTDSVKNRVPAGIKRGVEDIVYQSPPAKRQQRTPAARTPQQHHRSRVRPSRRRQRRDIFA